MTVTPTELLLYSAGILALFLTPGPVWLALGARALSGGFQAAWPLAMGVVVGDTLWPLLAILGMSWVAQSFESIMIAMRFVAMLVFWGMGVLLILNADKAISADSRLTRPGVWPGFLAGVAVILGNPKAILFYMGILPGFFDLTRLTPADVSAIVFISFAIPLLGNLALAASIDKVRNYLSSPEAVRRTNIGSGVVLILVGCIIPFT